MPIYEYNGEKYNIPEEVEQQFIADVPDAKKLVEPKLPTIGAYRPSFAPEVEATPVPLRPEGRADRIQREEEERDAFSRAGANISLELGRVPFHTVDADAVAERLKQSREAADEVTFGFREQPFTYKSQAERAAKQRMQNVKAQDDARDYIAETMGIKKDDITDIGEYTQEGGEYYADFSRAEEKRMNKELDDALTKQRDSLYQQVSASLQEKMNKMNPYKDITENFLLGVGTTQWGAPQNRSSYMPGIDDEQTAVAYAAARALSLAKGMQEAAHDDGMWGNFLEGALSGLAEAGENMTDAKKMNDAIATVVKKWEEGGETTKLLNDDEKMLLDALAYQTAVASMYQDKISSSYNVGKTVGAMAPFAVEFLVNPASGLGRKAASQFGKYALKRFAKNTANKYARSAIYNTGRGLGRIGGSVAGGAAMTATTGLPKTVLGVQERMLGRTDVNYADGKPVYAGQIDREEFLPAVRKEVAKQMLEYGSEMLGAGYLDDMFTAARKLTKGTKGFGWIDRIVSGPRAKAVKSFMERTGWNGPIEEFLEEVHVGYLEPYLVGDNTHEDFFNKDNLIEVALGVAIPGVIVSTAKTVAGAADGSFRAGAQERWKMEHADRRATELWGTWAEWKDLRNSLMVSQPEEIEAKLKEIANSTKLTDEQKMAAIDFGIYSLQYRTARGVADAMTDGRRKEINSMLHELYYSREVEKESGYNAQPDEMSSVQDVYEDERARVTETLGEDVVARLDEDPIGTLADMNEYDVVEASAYVNAKARRDGMLDRISDDIDERIKASDKEIDQHANKGDGMIHPAMMRGVNGATPKRVYIVNGNVATFEDGTIDKTNSSSMIIVRDAETGEVSAASVDELESLDAVIDTEAEKRTVAEQIASQYAMEQAGIIDGELPFNVGDVYKLENYDATVISVDNDNVTLDINGQQVVDTKANINAQAKAARLAALRNARVATATEEIRESGKPVVNEVAPIPTEKVGKEERAAYHLVPIERTMEDLHDGLLNQNEVQALINARIKEAQDEVQALEKKKPTEPKNPVMGASKEAYLAAKAKAQEEFAKVKAQWDADMQAAQQKLSYYNELNAREQEITRSDIGEAYANVQPAEVVETTPDEFIANHMPKITPESFKRETGLSNSEQSELVGYISSKEKGGVTIEQAAEGIMENYGDELRGLGFNGDVQDVRDMIIGILSNGNPRSYAKKGLDQRKQASIDQQRTEMETVAASLGFESVEDMQAYEEQVIPGIIQMYTGFDYNEYYNNLAENYEYDTTRESEAVGRGGELLQGEQFIDNTGTPVAEGNEGGTVPSGVPSNGADAQTPGNEQVTAPVGEITPTAEEVADAQAFADASAINTLEAYQDYLDNHPEGAYREGARAGMWMIEGINPETHGRNVDARNAANAVLARVEAPQATNKMQEAELATAAEPVGNSDQEKPTQKFGYRVGQKVYLPRRGSIRQAEILEFGDSYIRVRYDNIDGETITMNFAAEYFDKLKKQAEAMMETDSSTLSQTSDQVGEQVVDNAPVQSGVQQNEIEPAQETQESVAENVETEPVNEAENVNTVGDEQAQGTEGQSAEVPYSIAPAQYTTKKGKVLDMHLVKFTDELTKEQQRAAKELAKADKGWYDREKGGFMMRTEESAKRLADTILNNEEAVSEAQPVSITDIQALNNGDVLFAEPKQTESGPVWQYSVHVDKDGYTTISRDDVSGGYPVGDARFRHSTNSPEEMLDILRNPLNGMQEVLDAVGVTLENKIKTRELDRKAKEEREQKREQLRANGVNGYKIGDKVVYTPASGTREPILATIHDFEEYGDNRPVLDVGMAPVMYEVAEWNTVSKAEETGNEPKQVNVESLFNALNTKGEAKLSDHASNRLVTDERYNELKERMKKKLKGQMNIGIDPEILAIGTEMAVYHLEKGARKFAEFAKAMVADLGDAIRPYLKAFYNGARELPEVIENGLSADMTPYDEVQTFDVANFDKPGVDAIATADAVVKEQEVEKQVEIAQERIKKIRNNKKDDKKSVNSQQELLDLFDNGTEEENTATDNRGAQPGREELSDTEQVGAGASVEDTARNSKSKRRNAGVGSSELGNGPQYDVNRNYTNEEIETIVSSVTDIVDGKVVITGEVTDDIKAIVRGYESGGIAKKGRGILDEYYTDGKIVDAVNLLIAPYFSGSTPIRVLEPSVGIGNFIQAVNNIPTSEVVAFEINETTARIAKILYPDVDVNLRSFETEFIDESGNKKPMPQKYSLVIGNPPYGSHRGLYKGLGEESKIARYEDYFVKRSLDVLDEGGVLAMVLPSSWMDRHTKFGGYTIERAYRLPSGAFEATQVGTDIVILKKDSSVPVTEHAPYFEQFPERVLGEVKQRKGRYGRLEEYVEGDIDAAIEAIKKENAEQVADLLDIEKNNDALNDIESAVDETGIPEKAVAIVKDAQESEKADKKPAKKPSGKQGKYKVELNRGVETVPTSAQFTHEFSEGEIEAFADTDYEGALSNPAKHRRYANYIGGQAIHDFYYAEGDIYSKLAQLEQEKDYIVENYGAEQYEKQKALLESVLPKQKSLEEITISPNTTFVKNLNILTEGGRVSLKDMFVDFLRKLPRQAFGNSSPWEVVGYINNEQVHGTDKQRNQLIRERRKRVANDLFNKFLGEELSDNAKKQVVAAFNREYNSTYRPDYSKVPMFSTINRDFKGKPLKLTSVQLAGVGRMTVKGVGVLAHEVGFGKTLSGILAMHEAMTRGFAEKPLIVVPNDNILKQWVETIGEVLPNATVNTLGNLGAGYDLTDFKVNDGEFTIITYEGLKAMSFSDYTYEHLASKFSYITEDLNKHQSERDIQKEIEKKNELKGKMKRGTKPTYLFEDFGFDWLTVDEVHNANHIVSKVRLDKSIASDFRSQSQRTSDLGLKTWLAAQYIQEENNGRNVLLLSATPFTNKPLEYYSILSLVGNDMLERKGFFNVDQFFATFMEADNELEIGANGRPMQKTNVRRFRNNGLFQQLLSEFIDIKGEEDNPELVRPERLNKEYKIAQNELTAEAMAAAQELLSDNDTVLQGIGHARAAAFSPYATSLLGRQPKNHKEFVKNSPKIDATIKMIEQNIKDRPDAGQIIYSEVGVEYFPLIRDYLVKESGLKPSEVRIITGATSNNERVNIQTAFNNGEVKVVIGSPAIKEGLNLQGNTTDMYILSLPWNFTQLRQIEGRGWRQGNRWENIRINYMLTNDSVDVFMLQRLQLKQGLYNEAMKSGAESLDVSDIDTAELKTALITDPAVRAEIVTVQERAKLQQEKTQIEADLSFVMRKYEAYNKLVEKLGSQKNTIKMYREWGKKGDEYWAQRIPREEALLASIENEIEEEKQSLLKKGVNVDDIVRQTEQAQNAIAAIDAKIENLKEFQEELTQKFREESEAKAKEQGDMVSTYIKERKAENKGGFYRIRPEKTETKAAEEETEDGVLYRSAKEKRKNNSSSFNDNEDWLSLPFANNKDYGRRESDTGSQKRGGKDSGYNPMARFLGRVVEEILSESEKRGYGEPSNEIRWAIIENEKQNGKVYTSSLIQEEIVEVLRRLSNNEIDAVLSLFQETLNEEWIKDEMYSEDREEVEAVIRLINRFKAKNERKYIIEKLSGVNLGEGVAQSRIDELFDLYNSDKELAELYDRIKERAKEVGLSYSFSDNMEDSTYGEYSPYDNHVELNAHLLYSSILPQQDKAASIAHEIIHAVTQYAIRIKENRNKGIAPRVNISQELLDAAQILIYVYEKAVRDNPKLKHAKYNSERREYSDYIFYGTESVHEMVAELSNPEFRDRLKKVKYDDRSIWRVIWDAIKSIFVDIKYKKRSAYKDISKAFDTLVEKFDKNAYADAWDISQPLAKKDDLLADSDNSSNTQEGVERFGKKEPKPTGGLTEDQIGALMMTTGLSHDEVVEKFGKQEMEGAIRFRKGEPVEPGSARKEYNRKVRRPNESGSVKARENFARRAQEAYHDSMLALKILQDAVARETGNEVKDNENAYIAENRMSSSNKAMVEIYERDFFMPLMDKINALIKKGVEFDDIIRYLHAKHGLERNEYMRRKQAEEAARRDLGEEPAMPNEGDADYEAKVNAKAAWRANLAELTESYVKKFAKRDYSGLTALTETANAKDAEVAAQQMVDEFEKDHDTTPLWKAVNKATKETLRREFVGGLIDRATYDTVSTMFDFYIPLRGWDKDVAANEYEYFTNNNTPVFTPAIKTMRGRKSLSDDPIATIGYMAGSAIARANRNLMKQKFLNFVMNNPTSLATVSEQWYTMDYGTNEWVPNNPAIPEDATPEQVVEIVEAHEANMRALEKAGFATRERGGLKIGLHATKQELQQHVVRVMRNGKEYAVYINGNPRAAQALNGMTNPDVSKSKLREAAQIVKNFMARAFTSRNPAFIFGNSARDVIWAGTAVAAKEDAEYTKQYTKNVMGVLAKFKLPRLLRKFQNGTLDMNNEIERYFDEFLRNGGETGFTQVLTVEDYKKNIKRFTKEAKKAASVLGKVVRIPKKGWRSFWNGVEFLNRSAEDITRFTVYMTSRQMGRSIARSVYDAKEVTVNFNKKGSGEMGAKYLNFAYLFFSATIQSIANFGKLMARHPGKMAAALGTFSMMGFLMPVINAALMAIGDDDDMENYWNLPEWVRRNNIVLFVPWTEKGFITIPLPHELRPFYGMGENAMSALLGKQTTEDAIKKSLVGFTGMLPIDFTANGGDVVVNVMPTILQPFAQVRANVTHFGTPIYKDNDFNKKYPSWTKAYKGTNSSLVAATKWLNELGGGNNVESGGLLDWNPAVIEHLFESYLGGMGKTFNKMATTVSMIWDEDARIARNIPVASSFYQESDERTAGSQLNREYFDALEEMKDVAHRLSGYRKEITRGNAEYEKMINDLVNSDEFMRYGIIKDYSNTISELNQVLKNNNPAEEETQEIEGVIQKLKKEMLDELEKLQAEK